MEDQVWLESRGTKAVAGDQGGAVGNGKAGAEATLGACYFIYRSHRKVVEPVQPQDLWIMDL